MGNTTSNAVGVDGRIAGLVAECSEVAKGTGSRATAARQFITHAEEEWNRDASAQHLAIALFVLLLLGCGEDEGKLNLMVELTMPHVGKSTDAVQQQQRAIGHAFAGLLRDLDTTNHDGNELLCLYALTESHVLGARSLGDGAGIRLQALEAGVDVNQATQRLWGAATLVAMLAHVITHHPYDLWAEGGYVTLVIIHASHPYYQTFEGRNIYHASAIVASPRDFVCAVRAMGSDEWVFQNHYSILQVNLPRVEAQWVVHTPQPKS